MNRVFFAAALVLALATAAQANPALAKPAGQDPAAGDRFARMDTDNNAKITWQEFEAALPQMRRPAFDAIDSDKSGDISRAEWDAFRSNHGASGMGKNPAPQQTPQTPPLIQPPQGS